MLKRPVYISEAVTVSLPNPTPLDMKSAGLWRTPHHYYMAVTVDENTRSVGLHRVGAPDPVFEAELAGNIAAMGPELAVWEFVDDDTCRLLKKGWYSEAEPPKDEDELVFTIPEDIQLPSLWEVRQCMHAFDAAYSDLDAVRIQVEALTDILNQLEESFRALLEQSDT